MFQRSIALAAAAVTCGLLCVLIARRGGPDAECARAEFRVGRSTARS